jgi:hypothetical protein
LKSAVQECQMRLAVVVFLTLLAASILKATHNPLVTFALVGNSPPIPFRKILRISTEKFPKCSLISALAMAPEVPNLGSQPFLRVLLPAFRVAWLALFPVFRLYR